MSDQTPSLVEAAIVRLVGGDPLAPVLVGAAVLDDPDSFAAHAALALVRQSFDEPLRDARRLASSRRDRQHLAVVECWLLGDVARARVLAREHLAEFPDDVVVSWLTARR